MNGDDGGGGYKMPNLSMGNVAIASSFFLIDFIISFALNLKITKPLIISATRCLIQYGFILEDLFRQRNPYYIASMTFILILLTTVETVFNKADNSFHGIFLSVFLCTLFSIMLVGVLGIRFAINKVPLWSPEVFIPTIGLLLGLVVNAMAMSLNTLVTGLVNASGDRVEALLAMGATRWEATRTLTQESVRLAMLPSIQRMSIAGLIVIPGAMAGQIMGGSSVTNSLRYQQIIFFMITACSCLAVMSLVTVHPIR
ncbi:UPF0014 family [Absidia repens]|uniref:UPF0014 family n=1 Tax=Absidia repens TaxID=90262 RepID=A0A1X2J353_9FUNG|nr:UPF0014 family [Absidia repens]